MRPSGETILVPPGEKAPDFSLPDARGKIHSLSDYAGKWVVLYFYPRADTPGCTKQAKNFSIDKALYDTRDAVVIGISADESKKHAAFISKYRLRVILLSDEKAKVIRRYGAWKEKSLFGQKFMGITRSTFLIDDKGVIRHVYPKVNVSKHSQEVRERLDALQ